MKISRHFKTILALTTLLLAATLAGFLAGHRFARKQIEVRDDPGTWNEHVSREFERIVRPTPEQEPKIEASLDRAVRQLQGIRLDTIARSSNVIWRLIAEVEQELTPEQRKAFELMKPRPADLNLDVLKLKPQENGGRSPTH